MAQVSTNKALERAASLRSVGSLIRWLGYIGAGCLLVLGFWLMADGNVAAVGAWVSAIGILISCGWMTAVADGLAHVIEHQQAQAPTPAERGPFANF